MMSETLISKYNIPVPRYTSYPPANLFSNQYGAKEQQSDIIRSNEIGARALSYYIHIPFCRQLCHFCACNKLPIPRIESEMARYFSYLDKEIALIQELLDPDRPIAQIHFGGGSPTSVPLHHITSVVDLLTSRHMLLSDAEVAIEAHPGYLSNEQWQLLIDHRFTRFSIGIQDFDTEVLTTANRRPSKENIRDVVAMIHDAGKQVNLDFIYGLPGQTADSFERTIEQALDIRPDRLVTFSYAHVPWIHPQQMILERKGLLSTEQKKALYDRAAALITSTGYIQVGLDHFVLPDDPLAIALGEHRLHRNFQGYCPSDLSGQVYALGVTGISQLYDSYAQNEKELKPYYTALDSGLLPTRIGYKLSPHECLARDIITDLMCNYRCRPLKHAANYGMNTNKLEELEILRFDRLMEMAEDGLLTITSQGELIMNPEAHLFVRNIASTFDIHYNSEHPQGYSKPI